MLKQLLSAASIGLTIGLFVPYIRSIRRGQVKPHLFSWVVWALATLIVFFAQLAGRGGIGAWPLGVSGSISAYVVVLAYWKRTDLTIARIDWVFLLAALSALPLWFFTANPLWAVIILTIVDILGFGPTLRRAYWHPHEESIAFFALCALRNSLAIGALQQYSATTVLFPAIVGVACLAAVALLLYRRYVLPVSNVGEA